MSNIEFDELGRELAAHFSNDERILGSKVGGWLKQHHPEIDVAAEGGLRSFVEKHLGYVLVWNSKDEKSKVDDLYRLVGVESSQSEKLGTQLTYKKQINAPGNAWDAFVNPKSPNKDQLKLVDGILGIHDIDSPASSALQIQTVTREEERGIYLEFISTEASDEIAKLRFAMEEADYQKSWYLALRDPALSNVNRSWGKFRYGRLIDIFKTRLAAAGLPESDWATIVHQLVADYEAGRARKKKTQLTAETRSTTSSVGLAAFAIAAIKEMSDSELMQLWIPLHAALKAASEPR